MKIPKILCKSLGFECRLDQSRLDHQQKDWGECSSFFFCDTIDHGIESFVILNFCNENIKQCKHGTNYFCKPIRKSSHYRQNGLQRDLKGKLITFR